MSQDVLEQTDSSPGDEPRRLANGYRRLTAYRLPRPDLQRFVPAWLTPDVVRVLRWGTTLIWAFFFGAEIYRNGIPYFRSDLLLWLSIGLACASLGKRAIWTVVIDFLPFALVLIAYDYLRGLADTAGMPTWWHPQIDVDRFLFFGHEPTVWLQEHLKYPHVQWWDILVSLCYISFFFLPYITAAILWLRSRRDFYRWSLRFVSLSFIGFGLFALIPAAPPWAAANCAAAQVAGHPSNPACMGYPTRLADGGMLGSMTQHQAGANPWVERIATRGLETLHLHFANAVITTGQEGVDLVAAVPSLHAGGVMLFTIFMWRRVNKWWRPLLAFYPLFMAFTLVYSAEHYFSDVLAGWLVAALVCVVANRIERWRKQSPAVARLDSPRPPASTMETPCPPIATTPSSI